MGQTRILSIGRIAGGSINSKFGWDHNNTTGLTFAYFGGDYQLDGSTVTVADGTVSLTDNETSVVEVTLGGLVQAVVQGNESSYILYKIVTSGGAITAVTDLRSTYAQ